MWGTQAGPYSVLQFLGNYFPHNFVLTSTLKPEIVLSELLLCFSSDWILFEYARQTYFNRRNDEHQELLKSLLPIEAGSS